MRHLSIQDITNVDIDTLINNCTDRINDTINNIADEIYTHREERLVFICGPSSSGKTTFANMLGKRIDSRGLESHTLSLDDFFRNRVELPYIKGDTQDFDSVYALDIDYVREVFYDLIYKGEAYIPRYDFIKGERAEEKKHLTINSKDVVLIEGIHSFNPLIQQGIEEDNYINIYIEPMVELHLDNEIILKGKNLRLMRRMIRDLNTRGHSIKATLKQWKYVRESEDLNIYPFVGQADFTVNTFADYELMVYRDILYPELDITVPKLHILAKILEHFEPLEADRVPDNTIISEFTKF